MILRKNLLKTKKIKRNQTYPFRQDLEYPLVIALINEENIKLIEELAKVTPLTFLQEKDGYNQTVFIKMFRRHICLRREAEEIYVVDQLVSAAQKNHIAIDWLAQDTFFLEKTAIEYAMQSRSDRSVKNLLDLTEASLRGHSVLIQKLMDMACISSYLKPNTMEKLISMGAILKDNHAQVWKKY